MTQQIGGIDLGLAYTEADKNSEQNADQVVEVISNPAAVIPLLSDAVQTTVGAVVDLVTSPVQTVSKATTAVITAGEDLTPDQRKKAHEVIIPVILVSQILVSANISVIRRFK
jgi:hypothetical protein